VRTGIGRADGSEGSDDLGVPGGGRARRESAPLHVVALALVVCGAGLAVSAGVDALTAGIVAVRLAAAAVLCTGFGLVLRSLTTLPGRLPAGAAFAAVVASWLAMIGVSTAVYLTTGTFDAASDALFESVAGFTTTALSGLARTDLTTPGILFWRALTQWFGGFAALVVIVAVLPTVGVGGPDVRSRAPADTSLHLRSPRARVLLRQLLVLYLVLSAAGAGLYLAGGMTPFDAVTYAFTTISTGGFGNHPQSFRYFDSPVLEWLGIGGMALAGANLALLWQGLRSAVQPSDLGTVLRSTELRAYAGLIVGAGVVAALWTAPEGGPSHDSVRHAVFSVVSVISTTGHTVTDWGLWPAGAQAGLLALAATGAMSGSTGGGFRVLRFLVLLGYLRREVVRQLHPRAVLAVRVGRFPVDEGLAAHMVGYQVIFLSVVAVTTVMVASLGVDLVTAASVSLSAIATVGPGLADASPGFGVSGLGTAARMALLPAMLLGRLEVTPVLIGITALLAGGRRPRSLLPRRQGGR
jgi:trk system potassium uptake protein